MRENSDKLGSIAKALIEEETIYDADLERIVKG